MASNGPLTSSITLPARPAAGADPTDQRRRDQHRGQRAHRRAGGQQPPAGVVDIQPEFDVGIRANQLPAITPNTTNTTRTATRCRRIPGREPPTAARGPGGPGCRGAPGTGTSRPGAGTTSPPAGSGRCGRLTGSAAYAAGNASSSGRFPGQVSVSGRDPQDQHGHVVADRLGCGQHLRAQRVGQLLGAVGPHPGQQRPDGRLAQLPAPVQLSLGHAVGVTAAGCPPVPAGPPGTPTSTCGNSPGGCRGSRFPPRCRHPV